MTIFYHKFLEPFATEKWEVYFQQMPADIQERIRRYRKEENKYQLLIGRLLLQYGMNDQGFKNFELKDLYYDEFNCPLWSKQIRFNIAHSGNVVACAFSTEQQIGLDIEKIRAIHLADFDYILNEVDHQNILKADNKYQAFFKIWTIKEAVTKAIGKGLAIDVQQIYIFDKYAVFEKQKWYYHVIQFEKEFAAHIVADQNNFSDMKLVQQLF